MSLKNVYPFAKEEKPFLLSMLETPDEVAKLVWCDWLEERNDPRAEIIRTNRCYGYNEPLPVELDLGIITTKNTPQDVIVVKVRHSYLEWTLLTYLSDTISPPGDSPFKEFYRNDKGTKYTWLSNGTNAVYENWVPLIVRVAAMYSMHNVPWPYVQKVTPNEGKKQN